MKSAVSPLSDTILARLVVEHVNDGIVVTDAQGFIAWINPAFTKMSGYTLAELKGKRPGEILQGDATSSESREKLAKAIKAKSSCVVDIVNYSKNGVPYTSEINLSPIRDDQGELIYFVAVQRDVTRLRESAQESIDFKAYQRALDQQAIVSVADRRGRITYVNQKFCDISGYKSGELIGQDHRTVNSRTHDAGFFRTMWSVISKGETWHGEVCNRKKTGELYWVDTTVVPVHDSNGKITRYVSIRYDITDRKLAETRLRSMAETDALTGLTNRARFNVKLRERLDAAKRSQKDAHWLAVMMDLDHFKDLNDSMGHHSGDQLLKEVGRRLLDISSPRSTVARLGGDEFALILPASTCPGDNVKIISRLMDRLSEPTLLGDSIYIPSFSIGVTEFPKQDDTLESLMVEADIALYEAKRNGRNQWCFFDPSIKRGLEQRERTKAALDHAMANDGISIVLQPIVSSPGNVPMGFEVLSRIDFEGQAVPPSEFIPVCEELGLISALGERVMKKAAVWFQNARAEGLDPGLLSINVSAQQLRRPNFFEEVHDLMFEFGLSGRDLLIEVTETALIGRSEETVGKTLSSMRDIGISVALDDFGTGFSSLSHLRDFKVDKIKIDKSFVSDLELNVRDQQLVKGLISLGQLLGLSVVAEGVETDEQMQILQDAGCTLFQGYHIARPLSTDAATHFLQSAQSNARQSA